MEEFFENELAKKFEEMIENGSEYYFDTEELEEIIIHYLELGDISYAEMAVNFALRLHPASLDLKAKKLEVLLELEQYPKAKEIIRELRSYGMETTDFLVCCAKYYSNLGNSRKAIEYCEKALEFEEEQNFLHNFIADEFVNLEDPFNALKHYKLALKYDSEDDYALENIMMCFNQLNLQEDALEFLNSYLDQYPFSETAWYEYGQYFFNKKNYDEAIKGFDYLLAINSSSVGVYSNKASCYEAMNQWHKAIEVYEEMLALEYTKAYTYYKIGLCYRETKDLFSALKAFQKSLVEDPQFYLSMMEQSHIYEELGSMREALHFAKEAANLNESNPDYLKRLAFLYIDGGDFENSLACLKKLIEIEPGRFYNWYAVSEVLMLVDDYPEALKFLQKAIKKHKRAELYYQLSNCYFQLDAAKEGQKALDKAIELDPTLYEDMRMKYPFISGEDKKSKTKKK